MTDTLSGLCAINISFQRHSLIHRPKALIHTWLAWQQTPGMPMGQAITARVLSCDSEIAIAFVNWLNYLFEFANLSS